MHGRGEAWQEWSAWQGTFMVGACMVEGGMRGGGGMHGSRCVCGRSVSAGEMATEAGGMHPTGMHSCCFLLRLIVLTTTLLSFTSKRRRYQLFCVDLFVSKYCYITIDASCLKLFCYSKDIIL